MTSAALEIVEPNNDDEIKVSREAMIKVIDAWKILKGIPIEGPISKSWDKANWVRMSKPAKNLIMSFGTWKEAVKAMEWVYDSLTDKGYTCTIETIMKHADSYYEFLAKGGK